MASRSLSDLKPELALKAAAIDLACHNAGVELLIYCTLRSVQEQAKLYRQSRSLFEIRTKAAEFRSDGFGVLADVLLDAGPQSGPHVTNAGPGESWHNYGLAFDAVPMVAGKPAWSYAYAPADWDTYGKTCEAYGLEWAGRWKHFQEYPHAQLASGANPLRVYKPEDVRLILGL